MFISSELCKKFGFLQFRNMRAVGRTLLVLASTMAAHVLLLRPGAREGGLEDLASGEGVFQRFA
jgi:hypothetical protein